MPKSTTILWACHFQISPSGALNAMPIWMYMPFQNCIPYIGLLMSQSLVSSPLFPVVKLDLDLLDLLLPVAPLDEVFQW